ncbi:MAG: sensor histidine kinase [Nitrososphaerales archaeon]
MSQLTQNPLNKEKQVEETPKARARDRSFKDFITSNHIGLTLGFSVILVVSGLLFIFSSIELLIPGTQNTIGTGILTFPGSPILPLVLGVLLVASPFFLNSFVLHALGYEREMRIKAQKSTREAKLLQDILTHDIRNYNQVSTLSADLIREETIGNEKVDQLVTTLLSSIEDSTNLVERAKMLGRIISDRNLHYHAVNLLESVKRSFEQVNSDSSGRKIIAVVKLDSSPIAPLNSLETQAYEVDVLADGLLDEAFVNLISNSVNYTKDPEAFIAIEIDKEYDRILKKKCWKISIADVGNGISDELKVSLFSRYLEGVKGNGLGMSIVHALIVGRYGGRVQIGDRVTNNPSKGALVELWLPAA